MPELLLTVIFLIRLANQLLKRIQRWGSKHRSIIPMLKKILGKRFNVFNAFADAADDFMKHFLLHWAGPVQKKLFRNFVLYCYNLLFMYYFIYFIYFLFVVVIIFCVIAFVIFHFKYIHLLFICSYFFFYQFLLVK